MAFKSANNSWTIFPDIIHYIIACKKKKCNNMLMDVENKNDDVCEENANVADNLTNTIADLKSKLFDTQMKHEADLQRYQRVLKDLEIRHEEQAVQMRNMYERRINESTANAIKDFIVKNVLSIYDSLQVIRNKFQDSEASIAQSMSISLSKISNALSNYNIKESIVKKGDPYDPDIHNPLEVVNKDVHEDVVDHVYTTAWILVKNNEPETIRYADVAIAKRSDG